MSKQIFREVAALATEGVHPDAEELDRLSTGEILAFISREDRKVAEAVHDVLPQIEQAVDKVITSLKIGGRLIYIGAGTSGRLGIVDASECPPTFGSDPRQVIGLIAGGRETVFLSREGIEDLAEEGASDLEGIGLQAIDTVVGIASSSRTPYVLGALKYARETGAQTVFLMCNPIREGSEKEAPAEIIIAPVVGPEVVMGSTRLKAGTATKMILNMITTTAFIRLGKVYRGMMVDLKAWSEKLQARSHRVLMLATGLNYEEAGQYLDAAEGHVKTAIVMALCGVDSTKAKELLEQTDGFVRAALEAEQNRR